MHGREKTVKKSTRFFLTETCNKEFLVIDFARKRKHLLEYNLFGMSAIFSL